MDIYNCVECNTKKYIIFPNGDETLIICSACYRIRKEKEREQQESQKRVFH